MAKYITGSTSRTNVLNMTQTKLFWWISPFRTLLDTRVLTSHGPTIAMTTASSIQHDSIWYHKRNLYVSSHVWIPCVDGRTSSCLLMRCVLNKSFLLLLAVRTGVRTWMNNSLLFFIFFKNWKPKVANMVLSSVGLRTAEWPLRKGSWISWRSRIPFAARFWIFRRNKKNFNTIRRGYSSEKTPFIQKTTSVNSFIQISRWVHESWCFREIDMESPTSVFGERIFVKMEKFYNLVCWKAGTAAFSRSLLRSSRKSNRLLWRRRKKDREKLRVSRCAFNFVCFENSYCKLLSKVRNTLKKI